MTRLSVNINKIATIRNARGGNMPDLLEAAQRIESFGAQGITVHPRPDERHIRYDDVIKLKPLVKTEFNIEGYPTEKFIDLVLSVVPEQVTLVPDPPDALTSNAGWDTKTNKEFLKTVISKFKAKGIRVSIFVDTQSDNIINAADTGTNRIELYTEPYADMFHESMKKAVEPFTKAAELANHYGLEINAGHDLNLDNLYYFQKNVPHLKEVSIGHALISDALYMGLEKTVKMYLNLLS